MYKDDSKIITGLIIGLAIGVGASYMAYAAKRGRWVERMQDAASCMKENMQRHMAKCHKNDMNRHVTEETEKAPSSEQA